MFAVPAAMPVSTPVAEPMVAIATALLVQVPGVVASVSVVVLATHTDVDPVKGDGRGFTVMVVEAVQPGPI